jgi:hypothetical protein
MPEPWTFYLFAIPAVLLSEGFPQSALCKPLECVYYLKSSFC